MKSALVSAWRLACVACVALLAWAGTAAASVRGGDATPKDFLAGIYQSYVGSSVQSAKGVAIDSPQAVKRYFSHGLSSVILEDGAATRPGGVATVLGSDPFVGRESWDISDLSIDVRDAGPAKAVGTVKFRNFGRDETVLVDLIKIGNAWRIAEIKWGGSTLRGLYKSKWHAARTEPGGETSVVK